MKWLCERLQTPTSCKVVKINISYGTSIIQQARLHRELEPTLSTHSILSASSWESLHDFKPVSTVVISKRTRFTIGYGIFDESGIRIYFFLMQTANRFISGFAALFWISRASRGFQCLRWAEKLKLFLSSSVFMGV